MKSYYNLGCGKRYHPSWTNIDIASRGKGVIRHDLSQGIPAADSSVDVIYSSAVLEHIRLQHVQPFLRECFRVLKPGGIIRIAVPDLEMICRQYLSKLDAAVAGEASAEHEYDWMMLEVCDQFVRERPGGEMGALLLQKSLPQLDFILSRTGEEGRLLRERILRGDPWKIKVLRRLRSYLLRLRQGALSLILGPSGSMAYEIGKFRLSGEVHQWMYDRFSLSRVLNKAGFIKPEIMEAGSSAVPGWKEFSLEILPGGVVIKPDLFYIEAIKPPLVSNSVR